MKRYHAVLSSPTVIIAVIKIDRGGSHSCLIYTTVDLTQQHASLNAQYLSQQKVGKEVFCFK